MKTVIAVLAFGIFAFTSNVQACSPEEAQFIGEVTAVEVDAMGACTVSVGNWQQYNESQVCGLIDSDAKAIKIPADCSVKVGQNASGYLSREANGDTSGSSVSIY